MHIRPGEIERGLSIRPSIATMLFQPPLCGLKELLLINIIDTPGHQDFNGETFASLRMADGAIIVVDANEGLCTNTQELIRSALEEGIKPILFINKLDLLIQ